MFSVLGPAGRHSNVCRNFHKIFHSFCNFKSMNFLTVNDNKWVVGSKGIKENLLNPNKSVRDI